MRQEERLRDNLQNLSNMDDDMNSKDECFEDKKTYKQLRINGNGDIVNDSDREDPEDQDRESIANIIVNPDEGEEVIPEEEEKTFDLNKIRLNHQSGNNLMAMNQNNPWREKQDIDALSGSSQAFHRTNQSRMSSTNLNTKKGLYFINEDQSKSAYIKLNWGFKKRSASPLNGVKTFKEDNKYCL